jgi:peptidoglycan/xylan/chitin deacetylase (PgdA/CDA1 family)
LSITRFLLMRSTALLCLCAILLGSGWMGDAMAGEGIEAAKQGPAQGLRGLDPRVDDGRQPASVLPELVALPELRSAEGAQAPDADGVSETSAHIEQTDAPAVAEAIAEQTPFFSSSQDLLERCWSREELLGNSDEKRAHRSRGSGREPPPPELIARAESLTFMAGCHPARSSLCFIVSGSRPGNATGSIRWVELADPNARLIALTFDLCEQANEVGGYDPDIVNYLRDAGVHATFFAGGKWMRSHPERAKQLLLDPLFEVGNHSWTHGNLRVLKGEAMRDQILWTQAEYLALRDDLAAECAARVGQEAIDRIPPLPSSFRFPYGTCSGESLDAVASYGLAAVQWDIVTADPVHGQGAKAIAGAILTGLKPGRGSIVVMHANGRGWATAKALQQVIPELRHRGYEFVTISTLLRAGAPHAVAECYELRPGDNARYDKSPDHRKGK